MLGLNNSKSSTCQKLRQGLTILIMAGGSGERFWPLSTRERPKQLLRLIDSERSLIRMTVERVLPMVSAERIFIATNEVQAAAVREELGMIPERNIILEPAFRDTAAAIGYGCTYVETLIPGSTMVVLASDHLIKDEEAFRRSLLVAVEVAERSEAIVTLGIKPDRPETGYGYLETGECGTNGVSGVSGGGIIDGVGVPTKVLRFCEKPALERAVEYLESGRFLWNSGMFIFRVETMFRAFEQLMPEHWAVLKEISGLERERGGGESSEADYRERLKVLFHRFVKISIDFGIMEKFTNTYVVPVDFGWNDIGSYPALAEVFPANENNTIVRNAQVKEYNSGGNIVIRSAESDVNGDVKNDVKSDVKSGRGGKVIALLGVHDMVIVETPDAILVCSKEEAQNIKKIL